MNAVIAAAGVAVLVVLAILIGVSLDTEAQRVEWREIAHERRERREDIAALRQERARLSAERQRLRDALEQLRKQSRDLCAQCPLRGFRP